MEPAAMASAYGDRMLVLAGGCLDWSFLGAPSMGMLRALGLASLPRLTLMAMLLLPKLMVPPRPRQRRITVRSFDRGQRTLPASIGPAKAGSMAGPSL